MTALAAVCRPGGPFGGSALVVFERALGVAVLSVLGRLRRGVFSLTLMLHSCFLTPCTHRSSVSEPPDASGFS